MGKPPNRPIRDHGGEDYAGAEEDVGKIGPDPGAIAPRF
jgi:hypothetical protein